MLYPLAEKRTRTRGYMRLLSDRGTIFFIFVHRTYSERNGAGVLWLALTLYKDKILASLCAAGAQAFYTDTTQASTPEANVRVHIRRSIIQIQRKHTSIRRIVPVATADEAAATCMTPSPLMLIGMSIRVYYIIENWGIIFEISYAIHRVNFLSLLDFSTHIHIVP